VPRSRSPRASFLSVMAWRLSSCSLNTMFLNLIHRSLESENSSTQWQRTQISWNKSLAYTNMKKTWASWFTLSLSLSIISMFGQLSNTLRL
jgi:hypothetical protein